MMWRIAIALVALVFCSAQRDPILVPEVSQDEIQVRQGFTGQELLLFGAILEPDGRRAGQDYEIVVVLKGPTEPIRLREKQRIAGIWINAESSDFRSAPSFFAVASSKPIGDIVDDKTAAIFELGLDWLQLSPIGEIDTEKQSRFTEGLVDLRRRGDLYQENPQGVKISEDVLYQARIQLPSNVVTGTYVAETFAVRQGRVIASATSEVQVRKLGLERIIANFAQESPFIYGLIAVALSILMGWLAGRLFALV